LTLLNFCVTLDDVAENDEDGGNDSPTGAVADVVADRSSHFDLFNMHGLFPIYLLFISRKAESMSIGSEKDTNPYPLVFIVLLSLTTFDRW
jgi:hypothetical protein